MTDIILTVKPVYTVHNHTSGTITLCLTPAEAKAALESIMNDIAKQIVKD